ncbi:MAG: DNA primase, partial [Bacteroidota bacterium]
IRGTDDGIWRRIKLIPFNYKFPEDQKIEDYAQKYLFSELPGILRWAVEGYYKLQSEGLKEPDIIRYATGQYKTSEDTVGQFLDEFCVILPQAKTLVLGLYELYKNHTDHFMKRKDFNDYLERRGFTNARATAGPQKGQFFWSGIGIREQKQSDDEERRDGRPF